MVLLALIPARGGSKEIPRKNIRDFCGKPLLQWSIEAAQRAATVDKVVVSTDDPEIAEIAQAGGAEVPFLRPKEFSDDLSPSIDAVIHALKLIPSVDDVLLLQPTSPLRSAEDIDNIVRVRQEVGCESAVSITRSSKHPAWMFNLSNELRLEPLLRVNGMLNRQQLSDVYVLNGALYLASRDFLLREGSFITSDTIGYVMPTNRSVDIDSRFDWILAEQLLELHKSAQV